MIFFDSSVWVAFFSEEDSCHQKAKALLMGLNSQFVRIFDHIYVETLTVVRNKFEDFICNQFVEFVKLSRIKINFSNEEIFALANFFFFRYKKLSFTDCLLMASAKLNNAQLITFDKNLQKAWNKVGK